MDYQLEAHRTHPDFIVYVPKTKDHEKVASQFRENYGKALASVEDTGNEHFLVEPLKSGGLFAVWTQSSYEGCTDQRIVFATSRDGGKTWTAPMKIAGPDFPAGAGMASWAFPLVSKSGRIYVIYSRHVGINDIFTHTTGLMACIFSDDEGKTWSKEVTLTMPRSIWDNPDPKVPANWIVWQKPVRLSNGKYFTGFTRWVSPCLYKPASIGDWWAKAAVVEFMRFENVDEDPEPAKLAITYLASNEKALQVGLIKHPQISAIQEPTWIELPDKRIFCIMRTTLGCPYYSISSDQGESWTRPEPLRRYDDGPVLPHPCSPCPIYKFDATNYVFLYHNHDGHFLHYTPSDSNHHRRPICLARAEYRPDARQPIWFSEPWYFMDNGGVFLLRSDLAMYASVTTENDGLILWYPERKFFLLGKRLTREMVLTLKVPEQAKFLS